jgi:hypothetical protein
MRQALKSWLLCIAAAFAAIIVIAFINKAYAFGVLLSFLRGEAAMIYWMGHVGLSQKTTLLITVCCSSLGIINYFWWGKQIRQFMKERTGAIRGFLYKVFGIQPSADGKKDGYVKQQNFFNKLAGKFPYFILPLYCFEPIFGAPLGVIFAENSKLNTKTALIIMLCGNLAEKTALSYMVNGVRQHIGAAVMPITFFFLGVVIVANIYRLLYDH